MYFGNSPSGTTIFLASVSLRPLHEKPVAPSTCEEDKLRGAQKAVLVDRIVPHTSTVTDFLRGLRRARFESSYCWITWTGWPATIRQALVEEWREISRPRPPPRARVNLPERPLPPQVPGYDLRGRSEAH